MNKDEFLGKWKIFKGKVKEKWGKLTDNDITQINGKWDQLSGKLQEKYGWSKEQTEREMNNWCASCEHGGPSHNRNESKDERKNDFRKENSSQGYEEESNRRKSYDNENKGHEERKNQEDWSQNRDNEKKFPGKDENKDKKRRAG